MIENTINKTVGILLVLTDKLSGINDKAKENTLLTSEYEELNDKINTLSGMFSSNSNESDIVSLLNLPRTISEYTNDHIGEIISIPYNDESRNITGPIEFEVVAINHHKDVNNESKPTITLMSKNILRYAAFDAKESTNTDPEIVEYGNNRWSVSNIRQWLNSSGAANEWFIPQHEYDEAPTADKVDGESGAYADEPGFLVGFSDEIKQHFATVKNKTILFGADQVHVSKKFEETEDKVFLPSYTEMGYGNLDSKNPEGSHLALKFIDDDSRIKTGADGWYWMRSPNLDYPLYVYHVYDGGRDDLDYPYLCSIGIAPLLVLC